MAVDEITQPEVATQKGAQVGDENISPPRDADVEVVTESVDAQVVAKPGPAPTKVYVHETSVKLDKVITDPSSPEAVQIPDAGRGFLDLPIHALGNGTPEDVFKKASESDEPKS